MVRAGKIYIFILHLYLYIFNMSLCHFAQDCHFKWWFGLTPGLDTSGSCGLQGSYKFYAELPEPDGLAWGNFTTLQRAGVSGSQLKGHSF